MRVLFDVAAVIRSVLSDALDAGFKDYEDAVLHEAARQAGASAVVTRDPTGFTRSKLHIYGPSELLRLIRVTE